MNMLGFQLDQNKNKNVDKFENLTKIVNFVK